MREEGYYFVKHYGYWSIARYVILGVTKCWQIMGTETDYIDCDFDEIGDKIELPNN